MNTGPEVLRFGDYSDPSPGSVRFSARVNEALPEIRKHFPQYRYTVHQLRSRPCTTSRRVDGEARCRANLSTTREQTSWKNATAVSQGCTFIDQNLLQS